MNEQTGHAGATVIAITHVHFGDLGTLGPLLAARGAQIRYIDLGRELIDEQRNYRGRLGQSLGLQVASDACTLQFFAIPDSI